MRINCTVARSLACALTMLGGPAAHLAAQTPPSLDSATLRENRELDRQLLAAHERKDPDMVLSLFSKSPDVFFIAPNGTVNKGRDAMRESFVRFFARLRSIHGEIRDLSYSPAADGVIAVGTVVFHRQLADGTLDDRTVVWTDFRRKEQGKWVYVFRHAHWPLASGTSP